MSTLRPRYPGAPPFGDDDISRRVFFGRHAEAIALRDQIIAVRLVVVYARSGVGKSSLLNAGVAERLRGEGFFPFVCRVNSRDKAPIEIIVDGMRDEASRRGVDCVPGKGPSLWHYFKTTELWGPNDRLLTPVLVLDQFEELFTLQPPAFRDLLLRELSHVVRGVRPATVGEIEPLTDSPPPLRIVLSIRDDHLSDLEDAADVLPQILSQRFRLKPLSPEAAKLALREPAGVDDPALATRPFDIPSETVDQVVGHLSNQVHASSGRVGATPTVEPFQLQLICQRIEDIAGERQRTGQTDVTVSLKDLGGANGLKSILRDFYNRVLNAVPSTRVRRRVRRLCELYLISPEGRRLSLEGAEVKRLLGLRPETLQDLVGQRLLRPDQRANSTYYELSHDSLIRPILDTRRTRGLVAGFGVAGIGCFGLVIGISASLMILAEFLRQFLRRGESNATATLGLAVYAIALALLFLFGGWRGVRRGAEMIRRFWPR